MDLVAEALRTRRLLLVWGEVPFAPADRPPASAAVVIADLRARAAPLPPITLPIAAPPALRILSLDPTDRLEGALSDQGARPKVVLTRSDVPAEGRHSVLKLGGDLSSGSGLFLSWDTVRAATSDATKRHLLREASRAADGGAVLVLAPEPTAAFARIWRELVAPFLTGAAHSFALGPEAFEWPSPLKHLSGDPAMVLNELAGVAVEPLPARGLTRSVAIEQAAIGREIRRLAEAQEEMTDKVLSVLDQARLGEVEADRELRGMLDGIRRALILLQAEEIPDLDDSLRAYIDEAVAALKSKPGLRTSLEVAVPLAPLTKLKVVGDLPSGRDLRQRLREFAAWVRVRYGSEGLSEASDLVAPHSPSDTRPDGSSQDRQSPT